jgi:hypothetical protein
MQRSAMTAAASIGQSAASRRTQLQNGVRDGKRTGGCLRGRLAGPQNTHPRFVPAAVRGVWGVEKVHPNEVGNMASIIKPLRAASILV